MELLEPIITLSLPNITLRLIRSLSIYSQKLLKVIKWMSMQLLCEIMQYPKATGIIKGSLGDSIH